MSELSAVAREVSDQPEEKTEAEAFFGLSVQSILLMLEITRQEHQIDDTTHHALVAWILDGTTHEISDEELESVREKFLQHEALRNHLASAAIAEAGV